MTVSESSYTDYLYGGLLHGRYLRIKGLNEGSFGIVSIAKDIKDNDKLVAVKYNTGKLSDFEAYQKSQTENINLINEVRSVSLNSKTRSVIRSDGNYSNTSNANDKDVSKSIVLRETNQEILMLKKVDSHPNIITLLDHFDTFMIFEYAPRGDLHDAIQLGIAPVATCDVIDVFMQLISAVEFCHKNGVYHRDIKPENILISEDWSIKLTDFGLATDHLICNDFDVGSERYMAPELLEHSDIDSYAADKVDIWSLGICLLNIVFGKSPFRSASSKDKMFLHFAANRETLFDIFPFMSYDLFSVMIHSLTIDPANRDLEMIKQNLLNIDVLTYDYEFEEDDTEINNKPNTLVEDLSEDIDKPKEVIPNDNKVDNLIIHNDNTDKISSNDIINNPKNNEEENIIIKPNNAISDNKENELSKLSPKLIKSSKPPTIITNSSDEMESIDTLLEAGGKNAIKDKNDDNEYAISKPISIQKKYEPPHKFLNNNLVENKKIYNHSRKSNHYNNNYNSNNHNTYNNYNNNNNNNNNYRAKRWIPAHRKPLKIANYNYRNRSQDGRIRGRDSFKEDSFDFNRKDFFTPRSVFTSYMEKANKGKQQLQQRSSYYKKYKEHDNGSNYNNIGYRYNSNNNGNNNYYNYGDRRAWRKRKRRSSYAPGNNNNSNKNKGSYRVNLKSRNSRLEGLSWSLNSSGNDYKLKRRLSATGAGYGNNNNNSNSNTHFTNISSSLRSSMDGKYVPPNLRLNASHLIGSAIVSDDETDLDNDNFHSKSNNKLRNKKFVENIEEEEDSSNNDDSEEDTFSFELDQPTLSEIKQTDILNSASPINNDVKFHQIQSNAINLLSKQFAESKLFDDKGSSRNTSLTTTVSNNFSSTGSNINGNSPKGYKKYIPPHHRRSSHSAAETTEIKYVRPNNNNIIMNHFSKTDKNDNTSPVSTSAPTKSSSFFNSFTKTIAPHELLTDKGYNDFIHGNQNDDLFNIEEGKNYKFIK